MKYIQLIVLSMVFVVANSFAEDRIETSQAQLKSLQTAPKAQSFLLLDVRSAEEYADGHVPGAVNMSHSTVADNLHKLDKFKNELVIVYCRSGRRAGFAENILKNAGFTNVRHLSGDFNAWQANNQEIAK